MGCNNNSISIFKGFGTRWNDNDLITVSFDSDISLEGFSAQFYLGNIVKTYENIDNGFEINFSASETGSLPIGKITGTLVIVDRETNKKPFSTEIPFEVKDWEEGDIKLDGFKLTIDSKIQENLLKIKIETPGSIAGIEEYVREQISAHNDSESAHTYIQQLISEETQERVESDNGLQDQINDISLLANGYVHEQGVASAVWTVQHNLNKYPSVTVVDSSENVIIPEVKYIDKNTVIITMTGASKGWAYLN